MSMMEWAKREVEIASKRERGDKPESEWDYGCACYDSALKAFVGTVVKRTPTGLLDIEWGNGKKERFKSNGYEYHRPSGYGRTSLYLEPYTEERGKQVIQENKRKCMVGWLKEFDYTKLSYEEAEQVYTLVAGLKNS